MSQESIQNNNENSNSLDFTSSQQEKTPADLIKDEMKKIADEVRFNQSLSSEEKVVLMERLNGYRERLANLNKESLETGDTKEVVDPVMSGDPDKYLVA